MRWLKRCIWTAGIAIVGLLIFLVLTAWIPVSVDAHEGVPGIAMAGKSTVQATPTVDLTVTALAKEQLTLQVRQLQDQNNWFANNSTALIAAAATFIVALFGIHQWAITVRQAKDKELKDREDERRKEIAAQEKESKDRQAVQDKELRAQAEERFKTAVIALGDEKESVQIGGAILLRSFLDKEDKKIYGRYYAQIFDLAVAHLRLPRTPQPQEDPDAVLPLTTLSQALIDVYKETFPRARSLVHDSSNGGNEGAVQSLDMPEIRLHPAGYPVDPPSVALQSLDASRVRLDNAYLVGADLRRIYMREGKLPRANIRDTNLSEAYLQWADLSGAYLRRVDLRGAKLYEANLIGAKPWEADLRGANCHEADFSGAYLHLTDLRNAVLWQARLCRADLSRAKLSGAYLNDADLSEADLSETDLEDALTLKNANLRGARGLTKEQLATCKAKGAIIDEDSTTDSSN
jgi:uncharacterized protein YjbI with pentapeptide repeats